MAKKLTAYQERLCERMAQPGYWVTWQGGTNWKGRPVSGYLHWFREGRKWPEYESIPGLSLAKLKALGIIEPGLLGPIAVPEYSSLYKQAWRLRKAD